MNNNEGKIWYGIGIDTAEIQKDAQKANNALKGIGDKAEAEGSRIDNTMKRVGGAIAAAFTIQQASLFIQQVANIRGEFQQLEIAFTTMLKSKEKADQLMKEIVTFAATTPFDLKGVASGAKQLLAYGFEADSMTENLTMLGNVAAGVGSQIGDIIYLYGTLNAQGKVMTKDLMQFAGRGIPIYKELAAVLKTNEKGVMDMASSGKIAFKDVEQAFKNMVSEQGMFYNLMQEQSKSITGQISNLGDAIDSMFNEIGQSSEGLISSAISGASYLVENYKEIGVVIGSLVAVYGAYKAALITFAAVQSASITLSKGWTVAELARFKVLVMVESAQKILNKTMLANPYIAAATALAALVAGMVIYSRTLGRVKTQEEMLSDIRDESEKSIRNEVSELERLKKVLNDSSKSYDERKSALDRIKEIVPEYHASLTNEGILINNNSDALETYVQKLRITEQIKHAIRKQDEKNDELDQWKKQSQEAGGALSSAFQKAFSGRSNEMTAAERTAFEKYKELSKEAQKYEDIIENLNTELAGIGVKKTPLVTVTELTDEEKKAIEDRKKLLGEIAKFELEQIRKDQDLIYQARQSKIDAMKPSTERELEQLKLDHERKITEINRQQEDLLTLTQENAEKVWKANGGKGKFDKSSVTLTPTQVDAFASMRDNEYDAYETKVDGVYKNLKDKYQDYANQRKSIEEKFQKDIADLTTKYGSDSPEVKEAQKQLEKALKEISDNALSENGRGLLELYLYGDGSEFILSKIKEVFPLFEDITKLTIKELDKVSELVENIELTPEQLDLFKQAGVDVENLVRKLKEAKNASGEAVDVQKWEKIIEIANKLSNSLSKLGSALSETGGVLGDIGGVISGLSGNIDNLTTIFDKNSTKTDIISAGISGLADLYSMVANQIAENKQLQEEWNAKILEAAHNAALARIELETYQQSNIFGVENPYSKAISGAKEYAQAMQELTSTASALGGGKVQTGTKQEVDWGNVATGAGAGAATGAAVGTIFAGFTFGLSTLIGAGIGAIVGGITGAVATETVPVFESLSKKYGEIYNKDTFELNPQILADYGKLDDATKKLVDNWEEIRTKALEAQEQMRENFRELAGDIGSQLSDSLVNSFRDGDVFKAVDDFKGKVTTMIEDIISELIFAQYFEQMFKDLQKEMEGSFGEYGDQNIVDDLLRFTEAYQNSIGGYNEAMIAAQKALAEQGFDLFGQTRSASAKGFASMSQDSADELNGRFTAIQGHTFSIVEGMKILQANSSQALKYLAGIETNTARLEKIENTIVSVKSGIDDINNKGLLLRG